MPIDWFTVGAQIFNFLILVWLLKRFLYQPILTGLDAREKKIEQILQDADMTKAQAQKLQTEFAQKVQLIEQHRSTVLAKANEDAVIERKKLFDAAQSAADELLSKRLAALQQELESLQHDIARKSIAEVYSVSRKILNDLAGTDIQQAMLDKLIQRLTALKKGQYVELANALPNANNEMLVRSAFELAPKQKAALQQCIQVTFSSQATTPIQLRFSLVPELINGIELSVSGWKIPWSTYNYLEILQKRVAELANVKPIDNKQIKGLSQANVKTIA
jgi:F-type H+-transporting ATPase subunit b